MVGTGISCGIDSLCTIYDHFEKEDDPEFRINSLFLFNCGTHGDFENPETQKLYERRYEMNKKAADDMGLPVYQVSSNLHAFTHRIGELKVGHFALWSCALAFEKVIRKYYIPSTGYNYEDIKKYSGQAHDFSMAEFCEPYLIPLVSTEVMEICIDGSQYRRSQKTERIADWDIAHKHLNVCVATKDGSNCSVCTKCLRTRMTLDAMGKVDQFASVFNLDAYMARRFIGRCQYSAYRNKDGLYNDVFAFCNQHGVHFPNIVFASSVTFVARCIGKIRRILKRSR